MLLKNGCKVGLCNVISKGTVAENRGCFSCWCKLFVPCNNALGERLNLITGDMSSKADKQHTTADGVNLFTCKRPFLDRNTEVKAKFEEQFIENVRLGAVSLQMIYRVGKSKLKVLAIRFPGIDVA